MGAGRPSLLTQEVRTKIRQALKEKRTMKEVADLIGISVNTLDTWYYEDYQDFRTFYDTCNHERMLKKAEKNQEEYLAMDTKQKKIIDGVEYIVVDAALEKIKQDSTKFVQETLGKKYYSKRTENTGKDGGAIEVTIEDLLRKKDVNTTGEGSVHAQWPEDSGQEQPADTIHAQPSTETLPLQQDQQEHNPEGQTAGL